MEKRKINKKAVVFGMALVLLASILVPASSLSIGEVLNNQSETEDNFSENIVGSTRAVLANTDVEITPSSKTVDPCETFTVDVDITPGQPIKSWELRLYFDASLLQATTPIAVTEGDLFSGKTTIFNSGNIDNTAGKITAVYCYILGTGNVSGSGTACTVSFTSTSATGTSTLDLNTVGVTDEVGYVPITVYDGSVTVRNNLPTATIDSISPSPADEGVSVSFSGHGTDTDCSDTITGWNWRSSIDGQLSTAASFSDSTLSAGTHTIYFKVKDNHDAWSSEASTTLIINAVNNPPNTPSTPSGEITRDVGQSGTYQTSATDPDVDQVQYMFDWDASGTHDYSTWTSLGASGHTGSLSHSWGSAGTYVVKAKARDEHLAESGWSTSGLTVVVSEPPNNPPTAYIDSINPNPATEGNPVTFTGHGTDPDAGDTITGYNWRSSIDGQLSTATSFSDSTLTVGTHTIYFKVKDNHDAWSTETTDTLTINPNTAPTATIDSIIPNPVNEGISVYFSGHGTDPDTGDTITGYNWRSSIDGDISTASSFSSSSLSVGTHTIYFKVKDNHDEWSTEDSDTLTIRKTDNNRPTAYIDSMTPNPADKGDTVMFIGHGTDPDPGDFVNGWNWRSDIDGDLSTAETFSSSSLSVGTHTIYFKAKDNHDVWSQEVSDTLTITEPVNTPPETPSIDGPTSGKKGTEHPYDVRSTDPNHDKIKYVIDWGDGTTDTTAFYDSGVTVTVKHTWSEKGTYIIKVKAVDEHGAESNLATLSVSMPKKHTIIERQQ